MTTPYDFEITLINGQPLRLADYQGKVLLLVNTASKCGFTPQYEALEALHKRYAAQGLVIIGFPCNQFGHQEPGSTDEITEFCSVNYGVTFPISEKIEVNGANTSPLFEHLKNEQPGLLGSKAIKWNFTKFLVARDGAVRARYASATKPEAIVDDIEKALAE
ncbi:MAG TPA: glutathione peroxidase [Marinagarivorans sp.]